MKISDNQILLDDDDYKEIFSLFCSPTQYERVQIYLPESDHYFRKVDLQEEYSLNQETKEFSVDAWRSVLSFLGRNGLSLLRDGKELNLSFSDE